MGKHQQKDTGPILSVEIVDRPVGTKRQWDVAVEVALIAETIKTGKAVQIAFRTPEEMRKLQMSLRHAVSTMGLRMHYRKGSGDRIVAWAEKVAA